MIYFRYLVNLPFQPFIFPLFGCVRVHNVCSETLQGAGEGEVLSKIHLVAERSGILRLDPCVTQQRLEHNLCELRKGRGNH